MTNYYQSKKLFRITVVVDKDKASFLYFTLEASEGLCFYSTVAFEQGQATRTIEIWGPIEWADEVNRILDSLSREIVFLEREQSEFTDSINSL